VRAGVRPGYCYAVRARGWASAMVRARAPGSHRSSGGTGNPASAALARDLGFLIASEPANQAEYRLLELLQLDARAVALDLLLQALLAVLEVALVELEDVVQVVLVLLEPLHLLLPADFG